MPIKNYTTGTISSLVKYEPYSYPTDTTACYDIADMVSVDLQPLLTPTNISYYVGAESTYNLTMTVKNLTLNATLRVRMPFNDQVFLVDGSVKLPSTVGGPNRTTLDFTLTPRESRTIQIELNKSTLNGNSNSNLEITLPLNIQNVVVEGLTVLKNTSTQPLLPIYPPQNIVVQ
jgi:archaellum component FlaG (FlaF/FlaG flagellin family)